MLLTDYPVFARTRTCTTPSRKFVHADGVDAARVACGLSEVPVIRALAAKTSATCPRSTTAARLVHWMTCVSRGVITDASL